MDPQTRKAEHLTVDPPVVISCNKPQFTQNWALASFVSPEERVKERFMFEVNRFLYHDVNKQLMDTTSNLVKGINADITKLLERKIEMCKSASDPMYKAMGDLLDETRKELQLNEDEQVEKTLRTYRINQEELLDRYETYKNLNHKELEAEFEKTHRKETSVRGFKVRGAFEDLVEAKAWAKKVREEIEPFVHTFVFPVGYWVPFDPSADAVQDQEYLIPELNDLMAQKKKNAEQKDEFFAKRKQMMMDDAEKDKNKALRERLEQRLKEKKAERGHKK